MAQAAGGWWFSNTERLSGQGFAVAATRVATILLCVFGLCITAVTTRHWLAALNSTGGGPPLGLVANNANASSLQPRQPANARRPLAKRQHSPCN